MKLTESQKFLLRYTKLDENSSFHWKEVVTGGLGAIYNRNMRLGDVHRIVWRTFSEFCSNPNFAIPVDATYDVLTSVAQDFDYRFRGVDKPKSVEDVLQAQITKMLVFIQFTRIDWLDETWKE